MADSVNVCEKKLVEESDIVRSRYSPLCRQVNKSCLPLENPVMGECLNVVSFSIA